ncbi:hypothetical protein FDUTEX481_03724 [Tolypothrix sp. PCC 7601]|uniref:hypothetical protein n=2 Tax=unclassified Tolypothrix TaxID=2649714 RepID=UPI0005EAB294|nr:MULTISPECIES: hypothetical protein [unclassified Tolypothrix]EKE98807.1 hypothetical protein FDUTEX481_03724 [Tolypothrix sp. PCC 7601]UYD24521.1 hypothetical protein HGR01_24170 [Tolypothrix sp. PCC 7712]BAY90343.1 hypothetical protein NIES3275_23550 [Microchaete diplosiphon NIES-3275]
MELSISIDNPMLQTNRKLNQLFLAAVFLVLVETLSNPKVEAKPINNLQQLPTSSVIAATPAWQEFSSSEGKFSVLFPNGKVEEISQPENSNSSGIKSLKMHGVTGDKNAFIVGYADFSIDVSQVAPGELIDAFLEGMLQNESKLLSQKNIQFEEYPGKEIKVKDEKNGTIYNSRFFLVGQKIYFMMVGSIETPEVSDTQKFFNSFQLIK